MKKYNLFISYSHKDSDFVDKLTYDLKKLNINFWLDKKELLLGDRIIPTIRQSIDESEFFCIVISNNSINSEWVKLEVDIASNIEIEKKEVFVLPIIIENCEIPWFLKGKFFADFRNNYDEGLFNIVKKLNTKLSSLKRLIREVLIIDIVDPNGELVIVERDRKVKCIKGNINELIDIFSVEAPILKIETDPFFKIKKEFGGTVTFYKYQLENELQPGECLNYNVKFYISNLYTEGKDLSWTLFGNKSILGLRNTDLLLLSSKVKFQIKFPKYRPPKSFKFIAIEGNKIVDFTQSAIVNREKNRTILTWYIKRDINSIFYDHTIAWDW